MVDKKIREALDEYGKDTGEEIIILDSPSYDNSIIGVTNDGRLVYDYESMVEEFMNDENCQEEDAREFIDYNTLRAIPYMEGNAPVIVNVTKEELLFRY